MQAVERWLEIETLLTGKVFRIAVLDLDDETLRLVAYLKDGTNLRITEQWEQTTLKRYSYYWLTVDNQLKIGWDNAPHHGNLATFPHHKHIERQDNLADSSETCLEEVLVFLSLAE